MAAGEEWDELVARAIAGDCAGIECLSGIPGSVGGTPVQNVGAYGQEVSETISEVVAIDRLSLQLRTFTNAECGFSYRTSIFNTTEAIVTSFFECHFRFVAAAAHASDMPICRGVRRRSAELRCLRCAPQCAKSVE